LASTPITLDLAGGPGKYKKMDSQYDSIILRGTTDLAKMPVAGTFFSEEVKNHVETKLAGESITPIKIYFSGDDWEELASFGISPRKSRRVFATFTYRRGEACFYGVAEVVENYDLIGSKFSEAEIKLQKDLPVLCTEIN